MINTNRLECMLKMTQTELKTYLVQKLKDMGKVVYEKNGFIYAPGDCPVLMCAHMDIVYSNPTERIIKDKLFNSEVWYSETGIAGDDRCGIELILRVLESHWDVGVVFLEDEETGGIGAQKFAEYFNEYIEDSRYNFIIEVDRKGADEAVFYDCENEDFIKFITAGCFKEDIGSFSDISFIAPRAGLAAVNLSAGYHNEHQGRFEVINLQDMDFSLRGILDILDRADGTTYEYVSRYDFNDTYPPKVNWFNLMNE